MTVTQYTAQSREYLAIGITAFLLFVALLGVFLLWRSWHNSAPQRRKDREIRALCQRQHDTIDWVITDMGSLASPGLSEELTRLHAMYATVMNGRDDREIH
jgi:hypothetical protein